MEVGQMFNVYIVEVTIILLVLQVASMMGICPSGCLPP